MKSGPLRTASVGNAPVLLIHGAGGGGWEWAVWLRVMRAHGWQVEAIELQHASAGLAATRLGDYVQQVEAAAQGLGAAPILVGASLGGLLAMMSAPVVDPCALVLVNPLPPAPWHLGMPAVAGSPPVIAWGSTASLASTRRALPDADDATCEWAWRRWRNESGAVVDAARGGVMVERPACPVLVMASELDVDVPLEVSAALASGWSADLIRVPGASHVGPLLGRGAVRCAGLVHGWLGTAVG
jgi:pimeloyl-ACP methyl ester carboxylesterase